MAEPLGVFRIELADEDGKAHWGPAFTDVDEANAKLADAPEGARVVSLVQHGKSASWDAATSDGEE